MHGRKKDYNLVRCLIFVGCLPSIVICDYGRIQTNIFTSTSFTWNPPQRGQQSNPACRKNLIKPTREKNFVTLKKRSNDKYSNQNQAELTHKNLFSCISANSNDENEERNKNKRGDDEKKAENDDIFRLSFLGASVSPNGFITLLSTSSIEGVSKILPIRISSNPSDEFSASSVEALTILQLLAGVDMASEGVLPVGMLGRIVALYCSFLFEAKDNDDDDGDDSNVITSENDQKALDVMRDVLNDINYATSTPWQRVRVKLPNIKLEELIIVPYEDCKELKEMKSPESKKSLFAKVSFVLKCKVEGNPLPIQLSLPIIQDISSSASFSSETTTSDALIAFYSLALALRYKVPIKISSDSLTGLSSSILYHAERNNISPESSSSTSDSKNNLIQRYPKWKSTSSLQFQSSRALKTIERGFKVNNLDGALQIAIQKGDTVAEQKIREKMKEYESLDDLPVASGVSGVDDVILDGDDGEEHWA